MMKVVDRLGGNPNGQGTESRGVYEVQWQSLLVCGFFRMIVALENK